MATMRLSLVSLRLPEFSTTTPNYGNSATFPSIRRPIPIIFATTSPETSTTAPTEKPVIELDFIGPKPGGDRNYHVDRATAISGDKLLRTIMSDNKIELYAAYGKLMNCGGGGSCGTCIVEIIDGKDLLNEKTNAELKYLKKKPESWRLACQTIVGNKENSGKVVVQTLPQWKK